LAGDNTECGARYEAGDSGQRDELDYPAEAEQSNGEEGKAANECYFGGDLWARPSVGILFIDVFDNLRDLERHDRDGANGHIFGRGEQLGGICLGTKGGISMNMRRTQYTITPTKAE
jgi:hypothetical protein